MAEEEARRPRGEDGKPGGSRGQVGTVTRLGIQVELLSQALPCFSGSLGDPWGGLGSLGCSLRSVALQSGRDLGNKKRCVSSMPCWPTSGRASSYGRQPGAEGTPKRAAEWLQQILQRPQSLVRPEPVTFPCPPTNYLCLPLGSLLGPEALWGPSTHVPGDTKVGSMVGGGPVGTALKRPPERAVPLGGQEVWELVVL